MVRRVDWTRRALQDLRDIHDYIAKDSRRYAQIQVKKIREAVNKPARFPQIGRTVPEFPTLQWREVLIGSYRLIYRDDSQNHRILVLAVVHAKRLLENALPARGHGEAP